MAALTQNKHITKSKATLTQNKIRIRLKAYDH